MPLIASEKYPATPAGVRLFIVLYPVIMVTVAAMFPQRSWLWAVAIIFVLAWIGAVSVFLATTFLRKGYQAAIDDLTNERQH